MSMPAEPLYAKAISIELVRYINDGRFKRIKDMHIDKKVPTSTCGESQESAANETQLKLIDMLGTIITAMVFQILAILLWALESYTGKPIAVLVGLESRLKAHTIDHTGQDVEVRASVVQFSPRGTHAHASTTPRQDSFRGFGSVFSNEDDMTTEHINSTKEHTGKMLEAFNAQQHKALQELCLSLANAASAPRGPVTRSCGSSPTTT